MIRWDFFPRLRLSPRLRVVPTGYRLLEQTRYRGTASDPPRAIRHVRWVAGTNAQRCSRPQVRGRGVHVELRAVTMPTLRDFCRHCEIVPAPAGGASPGPRSWPQPAHGAGICFALSVSRTAPKPAHGCRRLGRWDCELRKRAGRVRGRRNTNETQRRFTEQAVCGVRRHLQWPITGTGRW